MFPCSESPGSTWVHRLEPWPRTSVQYACGGVKFTSKPWVVWALLLWGRPPSSPATPQQRFCGYLQSAETKWFAQGCVASNRQKSKSPGTLVPSRDWQTFPWGFKKQTFWFVDHRQCLFQVFNSVAAEQKELAVAQSLRNWVLLSFNKSLFIGAGAWLEPCSAAGLLKPFPLTTALLPREILLDSRVRYIK